MSELINFEWAQARQPNPSRSKKNKVGLVSACRADEDKQQANKYRNSKCKQLTLLYGRKICVRFKVLNGGAYEHKYDAVKFGRY
jgi:hypothetical protein